MSGRPFGGLFGRERDDRRGLTGTGVPRPLPAAEQQLKQALAADRQLKDRIAKLCQDWRARGPAGVPYASELELLMGWQPAGDPLTGCLPVTAEVPPG